MVGDLLHFLELVRREENRRAFGGEQSKFTQQFLNTHWIKPIGRLVQNEQLGPARNCQQ